MTEEQIKLWKELYQALERDIVLEEVLNLISTNEPLITEEFVNYFDFSSQEQYRLIHLAVIYKHVNKSIIEFLLKKGANINAQSAFGETALHLAKVMNNEEMVKVLLTSGINPELQNQNGRKASYFQKGAKHEVIIFSPKVTTLASVNSITVLFSFMQQNSLTLVNVPGDGNCFFHAIARITDMNHQELRARAVSYIYENVDNYRSFIDDITVEEFIDRNLTLGTEADHVIINALANSLGINIVIHGVNGLITEVAQEFQPHLDIVYTGNHYLALVSMHQTNYMFDDIVTEDQFRNLLDLKTSIEENENATVSTALIGEGSIDFEMHEAIIASVEHDFRHGDDWIFDCCIGIYKFITGCCSPNSY